MSVNSTVSGPAEVGRMHSLRFYIVDVFAERPLEGNPLAVVPDADRLSDDQMRQIAREFNQSETTFPLRPTAPAADWRLRSFTPVGVEVFGAGHNALGAWWWLANSGILKRNDKVGEFQQQLGNRVLPVKVEWLGDSPTIALQQQAPVFGDICRDLGELADALGTVIDRFRKDLPAQVVSTGAAHLLVALRDRAAIDKLQPRSNGLLPVLQAAGGQGCYAFSLDPPSPSAHAYTRFFNPTAGIWEDPATGSAAAPLACYLRLHGLVSSDSEITIEQGHAPGRPSRLRISLADSKVSLLGNCTLSVEGNLFL